MWQRIVAVARSTRYRANSALAFSGASDTSAEISATFIAHVLMVVIIGLFEKARLSRDGKLMHKGQARHMLAGLIADRIFASATSMCLKEKVSLCTRTTVLLTRLHIKEPVLG